MDKLYLNQKYWEEHKKELECIQNVVCFDYLDLAFGRCKLCGSREHRFKLGDTFHLEDAIKEINAQFIHHSNRSR